MEFDLSKPYCKYFSEMLKIPHESFNEQAISDWVVAFAKTQGLNYVQDEMGNVVVYKGASKGYETSDPIILQAHLDMVCEKWDAVNHDFMKDEIQTEVKDGWLMTKGTTLGADDGTGVSYIMAILADNTLKHPALECVFTVQEETGLTGSMHLKKEYFKAKRMINLDCGADGTTMTSTAGGLKVVLHKNYIMEEEQINSIQLKVSGLLGGHSGGNINKERANAIKLTIRVLNRLIQSDIQVQLIQMHGGNKDNAIPRECCICFASDGAIEKIQTIVKMVQEEARKEYEASDPDIQITAVLHEIADTMMTPEETKELIRGLMMLPNGLQASSMTMADLPMASLNLASISLEGGACVIHYSLRSALESWLDYMSEQLHCFAEQFCFKIETSNRYPAWAYQSESKLRELFKEVYFEVTQKELKLGAAHGGTECGVFSQLIEGIDIVTCAPLAKGAHTPQECLNLEAFDKTYTLLTTLLEHCK